MAEDKKYVTKSFWLETVDSNGIPSFVEGYCPNPNTLLSKAPPFAKSANIIYGDDNNYRISYYYDYKLGEWILNNNKELE